MNANGVVARCNELKGDWFDRNSKFKDWYDLLKLVDKLAQPQMESFVSNDPRTSYNLVLHMLTEPVIPHRIPSDKVPEEHIGAAAEIEEFLSERWQNIYRMHRRRGRKSWKREMIGTLLATGWYSVFAIATKDECIADVWSPAEVFPLFGETGMTECAHIFTLSQTDAKRMMTMRGWSTPQTSFGTVTIYDYWFYDDDGVVSNAVVLVDHFVKEPTAHPEFLSIPIFNSPVGGLPDRGAITGNTDWRKTDGESFLAPNEKVYDSYNRQWTFAQQMLRDTAQTRWLELSKSQQILKPQDMYKRGAIFRGQIGDSVQPLPVPPIPVELRADRIDMEQMLQRGGVPWAVTGNIQGAMTAFLMSQIAASAQQSFGPYHQGTIDMMSDIDVSWLKHIKKNKYKPYGFSLPKIPENLIDIVTADYPIRIPGDIAGRATVARMLNPNFELSETTVMDMQFPEIANPSREQAKRRSEAALRHPVNATIALIESFRNQADKLRKDGNNLAAKLYDKAADAAEATITPQQPEEQPQEQQPRSRSPEALADAVRLP